MPPLFLRLQAATYNAVVDGPGSTDSALRRQIASGQPPLELAALVQKIFDHAYRVTDDDVDALRPHYSEGQLLNWWLRGGSVPPVSAQGRLVALRAHEIESRRARSIGPTVCAMR